MNLSMAIQSDLPSTPAFAPKAPAADVASFRPFVSRAAGLRADGSSLAAAQIAAGGKPNSQENEVREAARELVALAFVHPLLAQAREDPFQTDMFHGGQGEKLFRARLDEVIADRMSKSMKLPLADAVYRQMMRLGPAQPTPGPGASRLNTHG